MKKFTVIFTAIILALLTAAVMPAQVFADALPEYISEVKIGMGEDEEDAEAALAGYKILSDDEGNPVDLNDDAGGGWGSKGDKVVYLGYKTTTKKSEAITDLALMNMKGGYSVEDYDYLMETNMKSQIIPFVDSFMAAVNEYRENVRGVVALNKYRAKYIRLALNKFTDDDCGGAGLGDLLLNETKYEMGLKAYNALSNEEKEKTDILKESDKAYAKLSDSEKKKHADIVTILAQSNGMTAIAIESLIARGTDTNDDNWLDRFVEITYDDMVDMMDMLPSDAEKELDRLYQNDANKILDKLDAFREEIKNYDKAVKELENIDDVDFEGMEEEMENFDTENADAEGFKDLVNTYYEYTSEQMKLIENASIASACDYLEYYEYGDGTLLDFFSDENIDVRDVYPIVASMTEGQLAGLDFVSLKDLILSAATDQETFNRFNLDDIEEESVYKGVDRGIYQKGGVAMTSDALRKKAAIQAEEPDSFSLGAAPVILYVFAGVSAAAFVGSAVAKGINARGLKFARAAMDFKKDSMVKLYGSYIDDVTLQLTEEGKTAGYTGLHSSDMKMYEQYANEEKVFMAKSAFCNKLMIGFTVAMVFLTLIATIVTYTELKAYYKVEFTPIPRYMVDEADITAFNESGEKVVMKNQAAYYRVVECNRTADDEMFGNLGTYADMNGDIGRQWLALYAEKNEVKAPILAKSLLVKVDEKDIPAGYTTGIHMFGSGSAFNLNSELYDWNKDAPSVMVYFKTETSSAASTSGSTFTAGSLALAGGAGLAFGALISGIAAAAVGRKKSGKAAA